MDFEVNDKVLVLHLGKLWEARILEVNVPTRTYKVHYQGWNKKHDEYVTEDRVQRFSEENLAKQKAKAVVTGKKRKADSEAPAAAPAPAPAADAAAADAPDVDAPATRTLKLDIPLVLKQQLVDDAERITMMRKLVPLPRTPNVQTILDEFARSLPRGESLPDYTAEIMDGLQTFFNEALGTLLLYKFERLQYSQLRDTNPGRTPAELYGAEHLMRLFVKLPELIGKTSMDEDSVRTTSQICELLLRFLADKYPSLFLNDYENPPSEYLRATRE